MVVVYEYGKYQQFHLQKIQDHTYYHKREATVCTGQQQSVIEDVSTQTSH